MPDKINLDLSEICVMYLNGMSTRKISKIYNCSYQTINRRLKESENENVKNKLKNEKKKRNYQTSVISNIKEESFCITANNTRNVFVFPIHLLTLFKKYNWYENSNGYLRSSMSNVNVLAHHFVIGEPINKLEIDHIDNDKKNNMTDNLRIVTRSENNFNKGIRIDNISGYRGVYFCKRDQKWYSKIGIMNQRFNLGLFDEKEQAALRYYDVKTELFGIDFLRDDEKIKYFELLTLYNKDK